MKRVIVQVLMLGAAAVLGSCSGDITTDVPEAAAPAAIDFRAALATRATETTTATLTDFTVTALDASSANFFTDLVFTKSGQYFTSTPSYYWPSDGSQLSFYAWAPAASALNARVTINGTTKQLADYVPAGDISQQQDLITATATGSKANETTGVALTFSHRLAQIVVKARNGNSAYVYKVCGVKIGQVKSKGTYDFATTVWNLGTETADYSVEYDASPRLLTATAATLMAVDGDNAMLLPQQLVAWDPTGNPTNSNKGAYLAVKINLTTQAGAQVYPTGAAGSYGWAAVPVNTLWEAGKRYTYTLDFSNGAGRVDPSDPTHPGDPILNSPIKFTVTVDEWQEATPSPGITL